MKRQGEWKHTQKLSLLKLVETEEKRFSMEIMSNLQTKKISRGRVLAGIYLRKQFQKLNGDWMIS